MDNLTPAQRRKNMQNVRSKDTAPELAIAKELRRRKIYNARNVKSIVGKPDFVFRRKRLVVFVDSDFWHGHPKRFKMPKSNKKYWAGKIDRNRKRDIKVTRLLRCGGWTVVRIWESDLKKNFEKSFQKIMRYLC